MRQEIIDAVQTELTTARLKFPKTDLAVTAFTEEHGEAIQAILNNYHMLKQNTGLDGNLKNLYRARVEKELIQTIAMAVRLLEEGDPVHLLEPFYSWCDLW